MNGLACHTFEKTMRIKSKKPTKPEGGAVVSTKPSSTEDYLAGLGAEKRTALEKLRKAIRGAAPMAEECIGYQMPAFRLDGRLLVAYAAWANHCALYPMSSAVVKSHKTELKGYSTAKGTIRFPLDKPIPVALVRQLVKARISQHRRRDG
jgi:uncharacterized protein YdhG (YjbR/CyaY superfamily)